MKVTRLLIVLVILTACLGQLNRLPLPGLGSGVVLYANDLLIGLAAAWYLIYVLAIRKSWLLPWQYVVFAGFIALAPLGLLLSDYLSASQVVISLSYLIRYACYVVIALAVFDDLAWATTLNQQTSRLKFWLKVILAASLLMSLSGYLQLLFLPDFAELAKQGWDPHIGRLATAMLDPNYAGAYLAIGLTLAASLLLYASTTQQRLIFLAICATLALAILLTYSRSAYLMAAIGLLVVAAYRARWLIFVASIVVIVAFSFVPRFQERVVGALTIDATSSMRIDNWRHSWAIAQDNQPFGIGYNSYRYAQNYYGITSLETSGNAGAGADSSWLFILATTGVIGLTMYLMFYGSIMLNSANRLLQASLPAASKALHLAVVAVWIALIPAAMINNLLFFSWILQLLMVLTGLSLGLSYLNRQRISLVTPSSDA